LLDAIGIGVHRPTTDVIRPNTVRLAFRSANYRNPDNGLRQLVYIRCRSVLEARDWAYSVRLRPDGRVYENFLASENRPSLGSKSPGNPQREHGFDFQDEVMQPARRDAGGFDRVPGH